MRDAFACVETVERLLARLRRRPLLPLLVCVTLPALSQRPGDQYSYERRYIPGEIDEYEIRVRAETGAELIALTEHETVLIDGVPHQRVRWLRATETKLGDLSEYIRFLPPYDVSLHPEGKLDIFKPPAHPSIVELVTDLYAFLQSLSPQAGIGNLHRVGDTYDNPELMTGDFVDGDDFLVGEDVYAQHLRLVALDAHTARFQADALPPADPVVEMHRPWMEAPVCGDQPNNFQMVQRRGQGFTVSWGCEEFRITSEVERKTGRILSATMVDELHWRVRFCSDEELTDCLDRPDFRKSRHVTLTLRPRPDPSTNEPKVNPKDGLSYVPIPAGSFQMGCVPGDPDCYDEETPRHRVTISKSFWLGQTEVTVEAYEKFCEATLHPMPEEPGSGEMPGFNPDWRLKDHPMVKVRWQEARDFCEWGGGRLPTEAEWEYAARGGADGLKYPWGNDRSHDEANFWRTGGRDQWNHTAPVGSFFQNGFGLYDMAGNVYEWTADWFDEKYYSRSSSTDPRGPAHGTQRVARGGPGFLNPHVLRISSRLRNDPDQQRVYLGFRCARDLAP